MIRFDMQRLRSLHFRLSGRLARWRARLQFGLAMLAQGLPLWSRPPFNALLVRKRGGHLQFISLQNYESRNESTQSLIRQADAEYRLPDFGWLLINTDDFSVGETWQRVRVLSYAVPPAGHANACPDFLFDHWRHTGLDDYEDVRLELMRNAGQPPRHDVLGWRGAETHPVRRQLVEQFLGKPGFDVELITWDRTVPERLRAARFMSLQQQQQAWRFLIDLEGRGYSTRLKLLLASGRVVFIQTRESHEFFYAYLVPWVHYVPVRSDLSDLQANLDRVLADPALERRIADQALAFVAEHLSRASALRIFRDRLAST